MMTAVAETGSQISGVGTGHFKGDEKTNNGQKVKKSFHGNLSVSRNGWFKIKQDVL